MKKFNAYVCMLACTLALSCIALSACDNKPPEVPPESGEEEVPETGILNTATLAYIPLDDRPVNVDRVQYLAESLDYTLKMPDADLYQTHLDNQKTNSNGTQYGDRAALSKWLEETSADCYVISLDQLLSGGLVESRIHKETDLNDAYEIIDTMLSVIGEKPAVVFDSVVRLASTVGYNGYNMDTYNALRLYGSTARAQLEGDDLTIENIVNGYPYDMTGAEIATTLEKNILEEHFAARERKLRIADYYLEKIKDKSNLYTIIGVDDSSPKITIQTNEIKYLRARVQDNGCLFTGIDELALMGVCKLYTNAIGKEITANVNYIGGSENQAADDYDTGTLKENLENHLSCLNIAQSETAQLQILVLTKPQKNNDSNYRKDCTSFIELVKSYAEQKKPMIVVDTSGKQVSMATLQAGLFNQCPVNLLLGYSSWNTAANSIGCALSNGITRYCYLKYGEVTEKGNDGFVKTLVFSYVKDICYKSRMELNIQTWIRGKGGNTSNFYDIVTDEESFNAEFTAKMNENYALNVSGVLKKLNGAEIITSLKNCRTAAHKTIAVENFRFPWYRTFEASFDIKLS